MPPHPTLPTIPVLNIPLFAGDLQQVVDYVLQLYQSEQPANRLISARDAHGLVIAHQDPSFRQVQLKFDLILSDGIPGVWVGRIKGARSIQRYYGPDFFKELMAASRTIPMRHFLCGGKESVAEQLRAVCEKKIRQSQCGWLFYSAFP